MKVDFNSNIKFQSKAYPVKPLIIRTEHGRLNVREVAQRDLKREGFILNLAKFFVKNFASMTDDPIWSVVKYKNTNKYEEFIKEFTQYYNAKIKHNNNDMTLLLVKDKRNKIQGACLSYGYDQIADAKETACYIDSIAINPAYRGLNVGKILIEKTLESAKNKFSDVFLTGDRRVVGFYKKMGFEPLNESEENQKKVIDYISRRRSDYPKYVEFLTKPLQEEKERWYDKVIINE